MSSHSSLNSSSMDLVIENFFTKIENQSTMSHDDHGSLDNAAILLQETQKVKRSNIMLLLRMILKELYKHRSKVTLTNECKILFDHLFVCLENCLQHGLKPRKQMFGAKLEIWTIIELTSKFGDDVSREVIESVRHLPKIRTSLGRARAWFRLNLMKKRLAQSFQQLVDHRDTLLYEYYDVNSLMLSDDSNVLCGLLVGLNSFDYSVYIKEEILDFSDTVIDLRFYLRDQAVANCRDLDQILSDVNGFNDEETVVNLQQLLDQNNYLEQVNQRLESTIKSLEIKIETFGQQNDQHHQEQNETTDESKSVLQIGTLLAQKEQELMLEQQAKQMLETRLEDAIKSGQEAETARNLLERDIQEKQDAIITLRVQLEEVKTINIQLFKKMQDKDCQLKEKNNQLVECESNINQLTKDLRLLQQKLSQQNEERRAKELAENYQRIIDEQQEQMTRMQLELDTARIKQSEQIHFQEAYNLLKKKFDENELALEEIGKQLQDSKLEIESLREYNGHLKEAAWARDSDVNCCKHCEQKFTISRRKHHCRSCGEIFCNNCSNNEMPLPSSKKPVRVCDHCHAFLLERFSTSN
ncbi:run domain containing protein [Dermatophagoides farinae]|uniref:Run domain containing protein n=1 Tax=Dermatophagoides farinae TaxID=6954 RepID=A0A9D4P803_DERFA|nr:RUN and FYVE domain-containing protein 2-like isoform X2 [Dermatophagoides farinae]KAH7645903.1 run domain containing protein [Dermatophagoides farinae]